MMSAGAVSVLQMKLPTQLPLQALLFICLLMHRAILGISITYLRNDSQRLNKKKKFPLPAFYITFNIFYTKGQYQLRLNLDRCQFKSLSYLFVCLLIAGLCRTCEIFGASALVLDNLRHVSDKQFQSLSVSSELWLPLLEVKYINGPKLYPYFGRYFSSRTPS